MTDAPHTPPTWAAKAQKKRRWARTVWPWDKLDADWKAREAANGTVAAAGGMTALHLVWLLISPQRELAAPYMVPFSEPFAAFLSSLILVTLAFSQYNRPKAWKAWLILGWSALSLLGLTIFIYGYPGSPRVLGGLLVAFAFLGVRGMLRLADFASGRYPRSPEVA